MRRALPAVLLSLAAVPAAGDVVLSLPIDCVLGDTCHIQQFVDRDSGPGARDYRCGTLSYEGHKGTDFALPTLADMVRGVDVLAAAPGTVTGMRDGMDDSGYTAETAAAIEDRECGNGLVLRHEDGLETQYCHMKSGSVRVRVGQEVARGAVLGQVGLSGKTQFPHLHLSVRRDGAVLDPFDGGAAPTCGQDGTPLWDRAIDYAPGGMLSAGFASGVPDYEAVAAGTAGAPELAGEAPGLVLFGYAFGGLAGDEVRLTITGPQGELISQTSTLDRNQARFFRAAGKRLTTARWPEGTYDGRVELRRAGRVIDSVQASVSVR